MDIFSRNGLKRTKNREILYTLLAETKTPISAESLYVQLKDKHSINLATVYRNLNTFVESEIAEKIVRQDGISYFSIKNYKHSHYFICEVCNSQFELDYCPMDKTLAKLMEEKGFYVTGHNLELYGICKDCQKSKN